ncbi:MAG: InlB B-repeat-containing protein, partial [Lachnospiraceae bacterium]|nr:InlB B-repeat-containing protein [Lachnospiraceae bacterium]
NFTFEGWFKDAEFTEKVTQIPKGSEGDITLYAKWKRAAGKLGLNVLNRGHALTTLDGETVSTDADGKPKVLIFYYPSSLVATNTNKNLRDHIKYFDGVDIYAVEMTQATKEAVASFKNTYGCDEITYCYDKDYTNDQCFWNYANIAHVSNGFSVATPVIVYIDAQNRVQYGTSGRRSYIEVLTDLVDYCGYRYGDTEGIYKITYVLDGGTNNGNNPSIYTAETQTIVLQDAVREGYIFEGWYKDAGFNEKVTQIPQGSTGDITLYAKWRAEAAPDDPDDPDNQDDTGVYRVVFDVQGHGTAPKTLADIKAGSTIDSPEEPAADGYRFDGWYKDAACTKPWDFGADTVQSNLTLYAKWLAISSDGEFAVQEITNLYYTGKAQKPAVSVYDENTLLKAGRDYTLKYYNNTNANKDGVLKGETFNTALPYVEITGKGNYKETVKINFNILPASIGNDLRPATGVTLKVNDQLVKANKDQKPFGSIKCGRNMKEGTDYILKLQAVSVRDQNGEEINGTEYTGAKVLANYTGEFMLTVTGTGNYTGSISRKVYVADKEHLMKNVKITLGKDLKNIPYSGS